MLSESLPDIDGYSVGEYPLVKSLLVSCYNRNPPKPRYNLTWDPSQVVNYIASLQKNEHLTVMLLALESLMRVSEVASMDLKSVQFSDSTVYFSLSGPSKVQCNGQLQSFFF